MSTMFESEQLPSLKINISHILIISIICILLARYVEYHWKRRKLYQISAQINGPLALPFIGNALYFIGSNLDLFKNFTSLSNKYKSPVRLWFGQDLTFLVWKPNDIEAIVNSPHALEKAYFYKFAEILSGTGLFTATVPTWKKHKKIIMPTMNQRILDEYVEVFSEQSEILLEQLKREVGKGIFDIYHYLSRCSLDFVCETTMGVTVNAQTTESVFMKSVDKVLEVMFRRMFGILYHNDFIFNQTSMAKEQAEAAKIMNEFARNVIAEKKSAYKEKIEENKKRLGAQLGEETQERKHFLQLLIEMSEDGEHLTDDELLDEVKTMLVGASDSTATTEGFVFMLLGMFPEIQDKVYQEIIDVLGPDKPLEHTDLGKLQYLEMTIKESLRIFPTGQLISRAVTNDIKLENCTVPAGSTVIIFLTGVSRDPEIWPNPLKFDPNRFLPEEVSKRHPYSWVPFLAGLRKCIGSKYAMMAMKAVVAMVIRKYRISTDYKNIEDIKLKIDLALKPVDGFRVALELRK